MANILVIDDEPTIADIVSFGLEQAGHSVHCEITGEAGLREGLKDRYDLVILDVMIPDLNGLEIMKQLASKKIKAKVVMVSAMSSEDHQKRGMEAGAFAYVGKPFDSKELLDVVDRALHSDGPA